MAQPSESTGRPTNPAEVLDAPQSLVDREAANPLFGYLMHLGLPMVVSVGVHVLILAFMAVKVFELARQPTAELGEWTGSVVDAADLSGAFNWAAAAPLEAPEADPPLDSLENLTDLPIRDLDLSDLATGSASSAAPGDENGLGLGDGTLSLLGTGSGAGEAGTGGFGAGLGGGEGRIGQAGIWDLSIRANKIAYVVDFSGSIIVAVDDLKRELKRSIGALRPSQSFNVILFYSSGGGEDEKVRTESFKPKLEGADEDSKREFFSWIDKKAARGVTQPLDAMKRALALRPDAVFFFSDGYFDDEIVTEIERANKAAGARIYCLVFDDILLQDTSGLPRETDGVRRLKRIAEANRGQVKIVTGTDLAR